MKALILLILIILLPNASCAVEPQAFKIPESAPDMVTVTWVRTDAIMLRMMCPQFADRRTNACATFNMARPVTCTIYTTSEVTERLIGHELLHCFIGQFH